MDNARLGFSIGAKPGCYSDSWISDSGTAKLNKLPQKQK